MSPYPDPPAAVAEFEYLSPLVLARAIEAVRARSGEDADYVVAAPYRVALRLADGRRHAITVPAGLATDLSSVPRLARGLVGRVGPHLEASIVHDYLYVAWQDEPGRGPREADREFADAALLAGMAAAGVGWLTRQAVYRAVRLFGWGAYRAPDPARYVAVPA